MTGTAQEVLKVYKTATRAVDRARAAMTEYETAVRGLSVNELRRLAVMRGVRGVQKIHRSELVDVLLAAPSPGTVKKVRPSAA